MPDIKISYQELADKTAQLRRHNNTLDQTLKNIETAILDLEKDFTSDTSDTIRSKIKAMEPKFKSYYEAIESYAKFLDHARELWQQADDSLSKNAESQFTV